MSKMITRGDVHNTARRVLLKEGAFKGVDPRTADNMFCAVRDIMKYSKTDDDVLASLEKCNPPYNQGTMKERDENERFIKKYSNCVIKHYKKAMDDVTADAPAPTGAPASTGAPAGGEGGDSGQ